MRAWLALLAIVPACGFRSPSSSGDAANGGNDASPPAMQFGTFVKVKFLVSDLPKAPLAWNSIVNINTDAGGTMCDTHNDMVASYCVVTATDISIGSTATLRAQGKRPLVLLATSMLDLQGTIDVSSRNNDSSTGAGAAAASACQGVPATGHSGGFGGSFGGKGGNGGTPVSTTGEAAGMAASEISFPEQLRGGCPGGNGVQGTVTGGLGGSGGGAVAIIAPVVRISGTINASGAGGHGGPANPLGTSNSGGGGGGSGGMIVIDTPSIMAMGTSSLFANGGGGGQGGMDGTGSGAGSGEDGRESPDPTTAAPAGNAGNRDGGSGGTGSSGTIQVTGANAGAAQNNGGGGGGGGGTGFIRSPAIAGASFAPAPTPP